MEYQQLLQVSKEIILDQMVPVLSRGFGNLVTRFREGAELREYVATNGIEAALDQDSNIFLSLRKSGKEFATNQEKLAERAFGHHFQSQFPDVCVLGEELGLKGKHSKIVCLIDPVDGTSAMIWQAIATALDVQDKPNYPPAFGVSVGFTDERLAVAGVIVELVPNGGELKVGSIWLGCSGQRTQCDGVIVGELIVPQNLSGMQLISTVPEVMFNAFETWGGFQGLLEATEKPPITGQNCIGFMKLLDSGLFIAYEGDLTPIDAAAIVPILVGAGIRVTDRIGQSIVISPHGCDREHTILAGPPALHQEALHAILRGVPAERNTFQKLRNQTCGGYAQKFPQP
ncbi:MAG: inositol monophosphatase family protein [Bdellovibrionales bacterium]